MTSVVTVYVWSKWAEAFPVPISKRRGKIPAHRDNSKWGKSEGAAPLHPFHHPFRCGLQGMVLILCIIG